MQLDVLGDSASFRVFSNQGERAPQFVAKQCRSLRPIAPPPRAFVANLLRRETSRFDAGSIRLVQLREQLVSVHELVAIGLRH